MFSGKLIFKRNIGGIVEGEVDTTSLHLFFFHFVEWLGGYLAVRFDPAFKRELLKAFERNLGEI